MSLRALTETELKNRIIKKYKDIEWNQIVEILREISNLKRKSEDYAMKYRRNEIKKKDIIKELQNEFPNFKKSSFGNVFANSLFKTR